MDIQTSYFSTLNQLLLKKMQFILSLFLMLSISVAHSQNLKYMAYTTTDTIPIERIDGGFGALFLDSFHDVNTSLGYSGQIIGVYNGFPRDTIQVLNGKVVGCSKLYHVYLNFPSEMDEIIYIFRNDNYEMEISRGTRKGLNYVHIRGMNESENIFIYEFVFRDHKDVSIQKTIEQQEGKRKTKRMKYNDDLYLFLEKQSIFTKEQIDEWKALQLFENQELAFYFKQCN